MLLMGSAINLKMLLAWFFLPIWQNKDVRELQTSNISTHHCSQNTVNLVQLITPPSWSILLNIHIQDRAVLTEACFYSTNDNIDNETAIGEWDKSCCQHLNFHWAMRLITLPFFICNTWHEALGLMFTNTSCSIDATSEYIKKSNFPKSICLQ